jgi:hypothetical protein
MTYLRLGQWTKGQRCCTENRRCYSWAPLKLREQPGWITFSLDGRFAYPSTGDVVDARTKRVVAGLKAEADQEVHSEKLLEVVFKGGIPVHAGDQFGLGRLGSVDTPAARKD